MILSMSSSVKSVVPKTMASLSESNGNEISARLSPQFAVTTSQCIVCRSGEHSLEFERLSQFSSVARVDLEDAAERVRMTPVGKFFVEKNTCKTKVRLVNGSAEQL